MEKAISLDQSRWYQILAVVFLSFIMLWFPIRIVIPSLFSGVCNNPSIPGSIMGYGIIVAGAVRGLYTGKSFRFILLVACCGSLGLSALLAWQAMM